MPTEAHRHPGSLQKIPASRCNTRQAAPSNAARWENKTQRGEKNEAGGVYRSSDHRRDGGCRNLPMEAGRGRCAVENGGEMAGPGMSERLTRHASSRQNRCGCRSQEAACTGGRQGPQDPTAEEMSPAHEQHVNTEHSTCTVGRECMWHSNHSGRDVRQRQVQNEVACR